MIKSLHIENFQSHEDSRLEFDPGTNVILGASDSGKSAIIRALKWVIWNRPQGESYRSHWGGGTRVIIKTEQGVVERVRGDNVNSYLLNGDLELKALRAEVPEEVVRLLNLNETNLQMQFGRPFLLDSSPGEVAAHFNSVAHLSQIDSGLRNVQGWMRQL
jgi:DNA repair exonuclease SbcCD ATPase subunit